MSRFRRLTGPLLWSGFTASPRWMATYLTLTLGASACTVLYPLGIKVLIDAFLAGHGGGVALGAGLVAGLYAIQWILGNNAATAGTNLADHVNLHLSTRIAELVDDAPGIEHFELPDYLRELDLLDENRSLLSNGPRQAVMILAAALRLLGVVILLGLIWAPLALLPLVTVLPVIAERWSVHIRQRSDEETAEDRRLANELFEIAAGAGPAKELRVYGLGPELAERHRRAARNVSTATTRAALRGGLIGTTGWLLFAAGFAAALILVAVRASHHEATAGEVVLAVTLVQRAQAQVAQAANAVGQLLTMARAADRLFWIEDYVAERRSPGGTAPPPKLTDGIRLDGLSFRYPGADSDALSQVDLHLPAGTTVAVVGLNGAGKSTLVKLLTGMYRPSAGRVLVDGQDLADLDLDAWRSRTAAGFQDFLRPELLAAQVPGIGDLPRVGDADAVLAALDRAGAADLVPGLPDGLRTPIGRSHGGAGAELSGGQWQKLALGRAMMRSRVLLLALDEPTASLDAPTERTLFDRYREVAREAAGTSGAVTVLVSHRFSTVAMADRIVIIDGGRVAEVGSHAELMAAGGTYAELYNLQAAAYR